MYTIRNLSNINRVYLYDDSEYVEGKDANGGCYRFWTEFKHIGLNKWLVLKGTSADFCPYCRSWNCNGSCIEDEPEEYLTTEEVVKEINEYENDGNDDHYVEIKE